MPTIVVTDKADRDLEKIHEHYESILGVDKADDIVSRVIEALRTLELFTGLGRPSQVPDVRELVITSLPFIAPYRVVQDEIQVLRVLHQRAERTEDW